MKWILALLITCSTSLVVSPSALLAEDAPAVKIDSITHTGEQMDVETVTIACNSAIDPSVFLLNGDAPRLVIDLPNSIYRGKNTLTPENGTIVSRIRIGVHREPALKTRIVIDIVTGSAIDFTKELDEQGHVLTVKLHATRPAAATETPAEAVQTSGKNVVVELPAVTVEKKSKAEELAAQSIDEKPVPAPFVEEVEKKNKPEEPVVENVENNARLLGISFDDSSSRGEMVLFHLNDFYPPLVSAIEKDNPRVLCDFMNMQLGEAVEESIFANGKYVERIRAAHHDDPSKVRVVLDLSPDRDYDLQQVFFKNDNLFVLIINELSPEKEAGK